MAGPVRAVVAAAAVTLALLVGAGPVGAVDGAPALVQSSPAAGAVVTAGPDEVTLTFDAPVTPEGARLDVVDGAGRITTVTAAPGAASRTLRFPLPSPLPPGRHLLGWSVTGAAGAAATGALVSVVDPTGAGTVTVTRDVTAAPARDAAWWGALGALAAVALLAVLLAVEALTARPLRRPLLTVVAVVAGGAAVLAAGLAGLDADAGVGDLVGADPWRQAPGDGTGRWWLAAALAVLLVPLVEGMALDRRAGRALRAGLAVLLVVVAGLGVTAAADGRSTGATIARGEASVDGGTVTVEVVPGRVGVDELHVYGFAPGGAALDLDARAVALTHRDTGIGPLEVPVTEIGPGHLIAPVVDLPLAGAWSVGLVPATADVAPSATLELEVLP